MLTFSAKPRILRLREPSPISLPNDVTLTVSLAPAWLFGVDGGEPRFVVAGSKGVSILLDANTGRWHISGGIQPEPLQAECQTRANGTVLLRGNQAQYTFHPRSTDELIGAANALLYGLPLVLNVALPFPCVVEHVTGCCGSIEFAYEVAAPDFEIPLVVPSEHNRLSSNALRHLNVLGNPEQRRLLAGLSYVYRASRLLETGRTRWEFMAEAVLNLAKSLEAIFPPGGDGNTRNAVRAGLRSAGLESEDIETWFMPALVLRSELDVAHVFLALLSKEQVETLTAYAERAIEPFRKLFGRLLDSACDGLSQVPPYAAHSEESRVTRILEQIRDNLAKAGAPELNLTLGSM